MYLLRSIHFFLIEKRNNTGGASTTSLIFEKKEEKKKKKVNCWVPFQGQGHVEMEWILHKLRAPHATLLLRRVERREQEPRTGFIRKARQGK